MNDSLLKTFSKWYNQLTLNPSMSIISSPSFCIIFLMQLPPRQLPPFIYITFFQLDQNSHYTTTAKYHQLSLVFVSHHHLSPQQSTTMEFCHWPRRDISITDPLPLLLSLHHLDTPCSTLPMLSIMNIIQLKPILPCLLTTVFHYHPDWLHQAITAIEFPQSPNCFLKIYEVFQTIAYRLN